MSLYMDAMDFLLNEKHQCCIQCGNYIIYGLDNFTHFTLKTNESRIFYKVCIQWTRASIARKLIQSSVDSMNETSKKNLTGPRWSFRNEIQIRVHCRSCFIDKRIIQANNVFTTNTLIVAALSSFFVFLGESPSFHSSKLSRKQPRGLFPTIENGTSIILGCVISLNRCISLKNCRKYFIFFFYFNHYSLNKISVYRNLTRISCITRINEAVVL